tara:strand:+ start:304 stop:708 length:405 start_codon:yes stop_codon:yes gene_type:complete
MSKPVFEDIFTFSGRRNRKSYFFFGLAVMFVIIALGVLMMAAIPGEAFMSGRYGPMNYNFDTMNPAMFLLAGLIGIPVAIAGWAVGAQRCRDFGWTGWAVLITVIPYIGFIFALVMLFIPGTQGENRYGPDPLE